MRNFRVGGNAVQRRRRTCRRSTSPTSTRPEAAASWYQYATDPGLGCEAMVDTPEERGTIIRDESAISRCIEPGGPDPRAPRRRRHAREDPEGDPREARQAGREEGSRGRPWCVIGRRLRAGDLPPCAGGGGPDPDDGGAGTRSRTSEPAPAPGARFAASTSSRCSTVGGVRVYEADRPGRGNLLVGIGGAQGPLAGADRPAGVSRRGPLKRSLRTRSTRSRRPRPRTEPGAPRARVTSGMTGDQSHAPYLEALAAYARRNPGRFHIPGHKGGPAADPELLETFGEAAFDLDIPALIHGIDVGEEPTPFQQAQRLAAEAWGARRSWFLLNGASQGNHALCMAVRQSGRRVVMQRNVHSSAIDGLVIAGLDPVFAAPELDPELGLAHCLTPESLAEAIERTDDPAAAFVLSPTYFGAVADVAALAEVAHERNVPLIVDEAWGAHLRFCELLPAERARAGRRRGDLLHAQDRRQPDAVGDPPPRSRRPHRRGPRRPRGDADGVHEPERAARRLTRRLAPAGCRSRRGAADADRRGSGRRPRARSARSPASTCSTNGSRVEEASPAGTRFASRSMSAGREPPVIGSRR